MAGEVVESLYQHRLLSAAQVRAMHAPHATLRWTQRLLAGLERYGLAASIRAGRGSPKLYFLTANGAQAAEQVPTRVETRRKIVIRSASAIAGASFRRTLKKSDDYEHRVAGTTLSAFRPIRPTPRYGT